MNPTIPNVSLVDAEMVFIDQGGETISIILSGRKRDFAWALSGDVAARTVQQPQSDAERFDFIQNQKRTIEQTIEKLQQIYIKLSE
jgi:hypothetical protein